VKFKDIRYESKKFTIRAKLFKVNFIDHLWYQEPSTIQSRSIVINSFDLLEKMYIDNVIKLNKIIEDEFENI